MKKISVALLVLLLVTTMSIPAVAIDLSEPTSATSRESEIAYMKIDETTSDVFPEDWELPDLEDQEEALKSLVLWQSEAMPLSEDMQPFYNDSVWLSKPSGQYNTSPFCSFSTTNNVGGTYRGHIEKVYTNGYNANSDATYNVGYSNGHRKITWVY